MTTASGDAFFNEVTFTGSIADASGLLYMNARYYNPATARFLSLDACTGSAALKLLLRTGAGTPWNLYKSIILR